MKIQKNKIAYYTVSSLNHNTGVYFKIAGLLDAARNMGYDTELIDKPRVKFWDFVLLYCDFISNDAKYIFLRDIHSWQMMFAYPFLIICRLQNKVLINDIPTPCRAALVEISKNERTPCFLRFIKKLLLYLKGPIPYWFFNKIIQYGNEGTYFSFGNRHKTVMLGNGIEKDRVCLRGKDYLKHNDELHLLGVANLQVSHGYDRIVRAISIWNSDNNYKVFFHLVSGNAAPPVLESIKQLVKDNNTEKYVVFEPSKNTSQLNEMYGLCDIAVGAIGIHRVGLAQSSALKLREYCLAGIPFIYSGLDPDFQTDLPFCFQISNDDSIDDILKVFSVFPKKRKTFTDEDIRQYAIDNLNYTKKLQRLGF